MNTTIKCHKFFAGDKVKIITGQNQSNIAEIVTVVDPKSNLAATLAAIYTDKGKSDWYGVKVPFGSYSISFHASELELIE